MILMVKMFMWMFMLMMITRCRSSENLYTRERGERAGGAFGEPLGGERGGEPLGGATVARIVFL